MRDRYVHAVEGRSWRRPQTRRVRLRRAEVRRQGAPCSRRVRSHREMPIIACAETAVPLPRRSGGRGSRGGANGMRRRREGLLRRSRAQFPSGSTVTPGRPAGPRPSLGALVQPRSRVAQGQRLDKLPPPQAQRAPPPPLPARYAVGEGRSSRRREQVLERRQAHARAGRRGDGGPRDDPTRAWPSCSRATRAASAVSSPAQPLTPPPLPGGVPRRREGLLHRGGQQAPPDGDKVTHGQVGEVTVAEPGHPAWRGRDVPGQQGQHRLLPGQLSRAPPPPLPGGCAVGEKVFFVGRARRSRTETRSYTWAGRRGDGARAGRPAGRGRDVPGQQGQRRLPPTLLSRSPTRRRFGCRAGAPSARQFSSCRSARRDVPKTRARPDKLTLGQVDRIVEVTGQSTFSTASSAGRASRHVVHRRDVPGQQGQQCCPHRAQPRAAAAAAGRVRRRREGRFKGASHSSRTSVWLTHGAGSSRCTWARPSVGPYAAGLDVPGRGPIRRLPPGPQ